MRVEWTFVLIIKETMNIVDIIVPAEVRYISDWKGFELKNYPHILDKQIPGCGFTEYCITNPEDVILVCPRKILLENKENQHRGEVLYAKSQLDELGVDINLLKRSQNPGSINESAENATQRQNRLRREKETKETIERERDLFVNNIESYWFMKQAEHKPCKILVTYDSFRKVKEALDGLGVFEQFRVVVDEFQSIFVDSRFKADTELEFLNTLQGVQKVCYVSATPMIEDYLDRLDEFKNLDYFRFDWATANPMRVMKPKIEIRGLPSINKVVGPIIERYKRGEYEKTAITLSDGSTKIVESKEAVFYVNSVTNIISIIRHFKLKPEEVNILCSDNKDNRAKIKSRLGKNFTIGSIPLKGEQHKMFTFCTRTVYIGSDFYSDNARTFILSDANVDCLAVDITMDLPQILGRQRLNENPWKNQAKIYARVLNGKPVAKEVLEETIEKKIAATNDVLNIFYRESTSLREKNRLADLIESAFYANHYNSDYLSVNRHSGSTPKVVLNQLALVAEQRAYDIQQIDYRDRFTVFSRISEVAESTEASLRAIEFESTWEKLKGFSERMKFLCDTDLSDPHFKSLVFDIILDTYKLYYITLGPEMCKRLGSSDRVKRAYEDHLLMSEGNGEDSLEKEIYEEFVVGEKSLSSEVKRRIGEVYKKVGLKKTPKAVDIGNWFETKRARFRIEGKEKEGFELLAKKTN